jgi:cytochrome c oxidase cbb3-type subunit 4
MDIGTFRGVVTAVLMLLFVGLVLWAWSRRRHDDFEAAARLPLDDDADVPVGSRRPGMEKD